MNDTVTDSDRLTVDGRPARVAVLVYNDAENDSRVLKESRSLMEAGADVKILAISNTSAGRMPGDSMVAGIPTTRLVQFSGERVLPPFLLEPLRSVLDRRTRAGSTSSPSVAAPSRVSSRSPSLLGRSSSRVQAIADDLARRMFATVKPGVWWADLIPAIMQYRPDAIHANDANSLLPAVIGARLTGARVVYDSHELWRHRNVRQDRWLAPHLESLVETVCIRLVDGVITVSPSIARWLQQEYDLEVTPTLVRNVPVRAESPTPDRGRLRKLAGLPPTASVIAYGGRITTSRGLEETFHALTHLAPDVHLVMLGYGEDYYLDSLWELARTLGVADRVHQVGPVAPHEVSEALADGDVAVVHVRPTCLSYRYSLPNKLFESIRGGLPIAAADLPDIREVVERYQVGSTFHGEQPADLARTVSDILADGDRYREAARRAAPQLVWENESEKLIALYRQVLAQS